MIANHIHDALAQVARLQTFIIERNQFKGYSGKARIASGAIAVAGATVMSRDAFPATPAAHIAAWAVVLVLGLVVNYAALIYWFLFNREVRRNPVMLKPALDAVPPLAIGGILAVSLIIRQQYDMIFGACMCLYGLAQVAYRRSLPHGIYLLGFYYLACGTFFLVMPGIRFLDPWPMALAFGAGEVASGLVLVADHRRDTPPPAHATED